MCCDKKGHERFRCPVETCRFHILEGLPQPHRSGKHKERVRAGDLPSCALWVAEQKTHTLEEVGEILGITRERVRQIEHKALRKLRSHRWLWERLGVGPCDLSFKTDPGSPYLHYPAG